MSKGRFSRTVFRRRRCTALFICIAGTAALTVCGIFAQAARFRLLEAEIHRALSAEIAATLYAGNDMSARYGLACVDTSATRSLVYERLTSRVSGAKQAVKTFGEPLSDPLILAAAIDEYMRYRLPAVLITQAVGRFRSIADALRQQRNETPIVAEAEAGSGGFNLSDTVRTWLAQFDFADFLGESGGVVDEVTDTSMSDGQEEHAQWLTEIRAEIKSFILDRIVGDELLSELRHMRDVISSVPEVDALPKNGQPPGPDLFDPVSISRFLSRWEEWLDVDADPLYHKCAHVEYVMGVCSRSMPEGNTDNCPYATGLDGRNFQLIYPREGADLERLITGLDSSGSAEKRVFAQIAGLRFIVRLAVNYTDPGRRERAHTLAATLCGIIALISGGSVVLPESALTVVIQAIWSMGEAINETRLLKEGKGVALCPGLDPIVLHYGDYLRIFLYLVPDLALMGRLTHVLSRNVPGCWARHLVVSGGLRTRNMRVEGRCAA